MSEQLSLGALAEACDIIAAHSAIGAAAHADREAWEAYQPFMKSEPGEGPKSEPYRAARGEFWRATSATRAAWDHLYALQKIERDKFAASRGWRVYNGRQGWVYTEQLIAGSMNYRGYNYPRDVADHNHVIDHRESFVRSPPGKTSTQSCRYPVAILSHTYGPYEHCEEFAREHGLNIERLPWSWYYPGAAIAALFTTRVTP